MLYSQEIIRGVAKFFARGPRPPLVVDPVMVATSGAELLKPSGIWILKERLLPLAALVTPNVPEAEILVGRKLRTLEELEKPPAKFTRGAVVRPGQGGHLPELPAQRRMSSTMAARRAC